MKVIVIGSGLIGVATAYFLRCRGIEVTVVDRREGAGLETSFANGGLLSPSVPEPWNAPGCWRTLLASLARSDSALQLRFRTLPSLAGWGITFLRNSNPVAFERNALSNLRLAHYSLQALRLLRQKTSIEYSGRSTGLLQIFRNAQALDHAVSTANLLLPEGLTFRRMSPQDTARLEPALTPIADQLAGAIHYGVDEVGDAYRFCVLLAEHARQQGVEFSFSTTVNALEVHSGAVMSVQTTAGRLTADYYILAAGSHSRTLARPLGIRLPVHPVKGYSVTFDPYKGSGVLKIPVVDGDLHAAAVPVGSALRVAGTAEFAGFDMTLRRDRVRHLIGMAQRMLPRADLNPSTAKAWCGLRPMSPDGVPIIGPTSIPNLWVNTGHGHLGWTMAVGSGQLLTDLLCAESPSIEAVPYAVGRFAAADSRTQRSS